MDDLENQNSLFVQKVNKKFYNMRAREYKQMSSLFGMSLVGYSTYYIVKKGHIPIIGYAAFLMGAFSLYINRSLNIQSKNPIKL